ncbi:hypothetical protein [Vibrio quintilis]|uniref:Uncharacterized protein n=1 Tax=Vibrio quintilis TaxID=1117707 RepID=A0A1M7YU04_9VIBR|nr:hypothetical protein [Vibrio quintilis]SHO56078.1 hypothetical protein VQ7734_01841 [Vibrio quintilis]
MKVSIVLLILFLFSPLTALSKEEMSDAQVRQQIIHDSIRRYPGNCPCPYSRASNGHRCGKRSAWSKPGGYAPVCYPEEISDQAVEKWRRGHGGAM